MRSFDSVRIAGWAGVAQVPLLVPAVVAAIYSAAAPKVSSSSTVAIVTYFAEHRAAVLVQTTPYLISLPLLLWFVAGIAGSFDRTGRTPILGHLVMAAAILVAVLSLACVAMLGSPAVFQFAADPALGPSIRVMYSLSLTFAHLAYVGNAVLLVVFAVGARGARGRRVGWPAGSLVLAWAGAAVNVITVVSLPVTGGPIEPVSALHGATELLTYAWAASAGTAMVRSGELRRPSSTSNPAVPAVLESPATGGKTSV